MLEITVDTSGFERKLRAMLGMRKLTRTMPLDLASKFQEKLRREVLDHSETDPQWVGRITGTLQRSQDFKRQGESLVLFFTNLNSAPYARRINERLREGGLRNRKPSGGRTYFEITIFLYGEFFKNATEKEFKRFIDAVNSRQKYIYKNQYLSI